MRVPDYPAADAARLAAFDGYFAARLASDDAVHTAALDDNLAAGLPAHDVSALQGLLLTLLIQITAARRILEIGTLGGYSTICMARALPPEGELVTIEANPAHAAVAQTNLGRAGVVDRVDLCVGLALDVLPKLQRPFDLVFVDAAKPNNPAYLFHALRLSPTGTVIVADNVVRGGVADARDVGLSVVGVRRFVDLVAADPRLTATAIQTGGEKGWDGFLLAQFSEV